MTELRQAAQAVVAQFDMIQRHVSEYDIGQKAYFDMCDAMTKLERALAEPTWIPVAERLPENGQWVLAIEDGSLVPIVYQHRDHWHSDFWNPEDVTHWQPLPEPPA